jgi:hypothetical protein
MLITLHFDGIEARDIVHLGEMKDAYRKFLKNIQGRRRDELLRRWWECIILNDLRVEWV